MSKEISVIMSAFNAEDYLSESIKSILNQEDVEFELIIINDGSSDNTANILAKFALEDRRVSIVTHINSGLAASLNKGIKMSKGEYIARMDADDIADKLRLKTQLDYLKNHMNVDILGSYVYALGDGKERTWEFPTTKEECDVALLFFCPIAHPAVMFRKSLVESVGFYDENFSYDQDYELWSRASYSHGIANLSTKLLKYRIHQNQMGSIYSKDQRVKSQKLIQQALLNKMGLTPSVDDMAFHTILANAYRLEFDIEINRDSLHKAGKWIERINLANTISQRYNDEALKRQLLWQYKSLCLYSANLGIGVYEDFKSVATGLKQPSFNFLLLISCILRFGREKHLFFYAVINKLKSFCLKCSRLVLSKKL